MTMEDAKIFVARQKWPLAIALIIAAGYTVGKDLALRDNARDAGQMSAGAQN